MEIPRTDDEKAKDAERRLSALEKIRQPFEAEVDNIITFVTHGMRKITEKDGGKGKRTGGEVYDSTALDALNILVDGLCGYTISRSFRWFAYTLPQRMMFPRTSRMRSWNGKALGDYPDVKEWLADYEEAMYSAFQRSNLYDVVPTIVRAAAGLGTSTPILEEDIAGGRGVFQTPHFRECYLAENRFGAVDTCFRVYKLSHRQMKDKWGLEKLKAIWPDFESKLERLPYEEAEVLHAIHPRSDYSPERIDKKSLPVASDWFLRSPSKLIEESGYKEAPFFSWRWRKNDDETYGRGPVWDAMVDIMTGQQQGRTNLIAGHKMAEPAMVGQEDLRGKVNSGPAGWTWVSNMENMPRPLMEKIQLPYSVEAQARTDEKIRRHLQTDFFIMLSQAAMNKVELTATQVMEMGGEKAAILSTRIGAAETELMVPVHERLSAIEDRAGRLPPPPEILLSLGVTGTEIEFLGPFSQLQRRVFKSKGIKAGLEALGTLLLPIYPEAKHIIDPIKTGKDLLESYGFPAKDFRPQEEIDSALEQEGQAAMLTQQGPEIAKLLKAIPGLGKTVDEKSPLAGLLQEGESAE